MIEHMRQDKLIVERLFGGAAQLIETSGSGVKPGTVEVRVGGRPVASGGTLREAIAGVRMHGPKHGVVEAIQ